MYISICVFMISALCWLKRGIMKYKGCIIPWIDFNCPGLGTDLYGSLLWMNSSLFVLTSQASRRVLRLACSGVGTWKNHCLNDWWSLILESTISPSCRFLVVGCLIFAVDVIFLAKDDVAWWLLGGNVSLCKAKLKHQICKWVDCPVWALPLEGQPGDW